jgi:hypothetical protein
MELTENQLYFVRDSLWRTSILDGYNSVIKCGLHDYIKKNEIKSFMYDTPPEKQNEFMYLYRLADLRVGHSGASYGVTMRIVERIIKGGFDGWKIDYIKANRTDMVRSIRRLQKHIRRVMSDPQYMLCKNRLNYEFELLI